MTPKELYDQCVASPDCDIQKHLPFLRSCARGNVIEIGVRWGVSTAAFLLGLETNGGHLYSVDVNPDCASRFSHPQWSFLAASSADASAVRRFAPASVSVLFIVGDHSYAAV